MQELDECWEGEIHHSLDLLLCASCHVGFKYTLAAASKIVSFYVEGK